jgi:uncharacterized membrane protein
MTIKQGRQRFSAWWYDLQDSLWFVPALITLLSLVLALGLLQLDHALRLDQRAADSASYFFAFGGGTEGARGVLAAIAGTMITVTGVVFSLTVVSLQLASSQYTPRILRRFTGDRGNQVVLGVFIGTFTYALLVLRSIRSNEDPGLVFVPAISVTVAIGLVVLSIGFLIFFIHHTTRSIQASVIVQHAADETLTLVDRTFPEELDESERNPPPVPPLPDTSAFRVRVDYGGYVQSVDESSLADLAVADDVERVIRLEHHVGSYLVSGVVIASVWPASSCNGDVEDGIQKAVILGTERTMQADIGYGVRQLADIAIKALSPGINDPTTATMAVDRIADVLVRIGSRPTRPPVRRGCDGRGLLLLPGPTFEQLVDLAFTQIRHYGIADPMVAEHLVLVLGRVSEHVVVEHRAILIDHAHRMLEAAREELTLQVDRDRVERAAVWTEATAYAG